MSHTPQIRITIDGRLALTVEQAAERYGLTRGGMSAALSRLTVAHDAMLDGRKPLYLASRLDKAMKERPGKGSNLTAEARARRAAPPDTGEAAQR